MGPWRIVFMGTPAFACPTLEGLLRGMDQVVGVVCQPDRPRGRGLELTAPEVKRLALSRGLPVFQPERVRDATFQATLESLAPDLIVVAAYGRILPRAVLDLPPRGCINVHASLLPRHRGAAPIQWSILAGDTETGITIMAMNEEMDAGDILLKRTTPIGREESAGELGARLAFLGAEALGEAINGIKTGSIRPEPQPAAGVTFAPRIEREQGRLDWRRAAEELARLVRAFSPAPSAFTTLGGRTLKVHRAIAIPGPAGGTDGTVVAADAEGIEVATGDGRLRLLEVQLEGRRRMSAAQFLAGHALERGTCLGGA
jgi:methionyl-tRNA formyltransferase